MFFYNYFDPDLRVVIFCEKEGPPEHKVKLINKIEEYEIDYEIEEQAPLHTCNGVEGNFMESLSPFLFLFYFYLFTYLFICLFIYLFTYLFIYLFFDDKEIVLSESCPGGGQHETMVTSKVVPEDKILQLRSKSNYGYFHCAILKAFYGFMEKRVHESTFLKIFIINFLRF